jgi:Cytochrome c oxidase subunit IV
MRMAHAISNPTLADIEKRWEGMPPQEQADLWMQLRDRMKVNWAELTVQEKKAGTSSCPHPQLPSPVSISIPLHLNSLTLQSRSKKMQGEELGNEDKLGAFANAKKQNSILHRLRRARPPLHLPPRRRLESRRLHSHRRRRQLRGICGH